jgi:uncharacterized protein YciI
MPVVPDGYSMFVVDLHYVASADRVEAAFSGHIDFVKANFATGMFIASGGKVSKTGGVIIAVAENIGKLEAILHEDPYQKLGLAEFRITEFVPAILAPQFVK